MRIAHETAPVPDPLRNETSTGELREAHDSSPPRPPRTSDARASEPVRAASRASATTSFRLAVWPTRPTDGGATSPLRLHPRLADPVLDPEVQLRARAVPVLPTLSRR